MKLPAHLQLYASPQTARGPWGLCPQTPGIYRFLPARMARFDFLKGDGLLPAPSPFRPLSRSLGSLPSVALSRPDSGVTSINPSRSQLNEIAASGKLSEVSLSQPRGAVHVIPARQTAKCDRLSYQLPEIRFHHPRRGRRSRDHPHVHHELQILPLPVLGCIF